MQIGGTDVGSSDADGPKSSATLPSDSSGEALSVTSEDVLGRQRYDVGTGLFLIPQVTDRFSDIVADPIRAEWPVSKATLARSGAFAPLMKAFLDEMEPLVGLISDEVGAGEDRFQTARNILMAYGYLRLVIIMRDAVFVLGCNWDFDDGQAQRDLRVGWIDDGPNDAHEYIPWGYNDDYVYGVQNLNPVAKLESLIDLIGDINEKYPFVPDWEIRQSAELKLLRSFCGLMEVEPAPFIRHFGFEDYTEISDWREFLQDMQGEVGLGSIAYFQEALLEIEPLFSENEKLLARFVLLREFSRSFQPPYSKRDMDVWKLVAKESYERIRANEKLKPFIDNLFKKPFEPHYDTEIPNVEVFEEIVEDAGKLPLEASLKNSTEAVRYFSALADFRLRIASREHYLSFRLREGIQDQLNEWWDRINEFRKAEIEQAKVIRDGTYMHEIDALVGLDSIKQKLVRLGQLAARPELKSEIPPASHIVFSGNPGTGKTTVAKILGQIYQALGLLSKGHVVSVTRADLVAPYVGQTAPLVAEAVQKAMGGVLFIDEAYTLRRSAMGESDPFGQEAIDALLTHMEDKRGDFIVIAAGYPAEMTRFVDSNPGLGSRFGERWLFDDYSENDLWKIFEGLSTSAEVSLDTDLGEEFRQLATSAKKAKDFSNARWARSLFEDARVRRASRLSEGEQERNLVVRDLSNKQEAALVGAATIASIESKLSELVGLESVKEDIRDIIALQNLQVRRQREGLPLTVNPMSHLVFSGPPGTGKTTVARLIGQIYKELGGLPSGHVVETQRADLVAGFVGQTAIKTQEVANKAMGGVLFVDEAYMLSSNGDSSSVDFGQEAIDTILKVMEDRKGEFVIIVAGYEDRMRDFLASNPGLASRFGKTFRFSKWSAEELLRDVTNALQKQHLVLEEEALRRLTASLPRIIGWNDYASGRTSRTLVEKLIEVQARRLSRQEDLDLGQIVSEDVESALARLDIPILDHARNSTNTNSKRVD
jgi:SpoVK/Ycf46/Vps4 family AAA+-type ATPase